MGKRQKHKKRNGKKKNPASGHVRVSDRVAKIASGKSRHPKLFRAIDALIADANRALTQAPAPAEPDAKFIVHRGMWMRAFNALKGTKLLLEVDHWELAQGMVRQEFELVVNLEELGRQTDSDLAATTYLRFGALQDAMELLAHVRYTLDTGRGDDQMKEAVSVLDRSLPVVFAEFRKTDKNGKQYWAKSWCQKDTRALAVATGGIRLSQYELVFRPASTQIHAGPGAVTGWPKEMQQTMESLQRMVGRDTGKLSETGAMAITFFLQIWLTVQSAIPLVAEPTKYMALLVDAMEATHETLPWDRVRSGTHVVPPTPFTA